MIATRVNFETALVYVFTTSLSTEASVGAIAEELIVFRSARSVEAGIIGETAVLEIAELAGQAFGAFALEFILVFTTKLSKLLIVKLKYRFKW